MPHAKKPIFLLLVSLLSALLLVTACAPPDTRPSDEQAIRRADAQWSKAAQAHDLDGTLSYYADDAVLLVPNAPIAVDKQSIRESWVALLGPTLSISWQITKIDVARSGDLAYLVGTYSLTSKDAHGNPSSDRGKLIEVWKKQADGQWKAVADTYNSDLPGPSA